MRSGSAAITTNQGQTTFSSPEDLRDRLFVLFPRFRDHCSQGERDADDRLTYHAVMLDFASFFGGGLAELSERQLVSLSKVVNAAVETRGEVENAISTCVLEHLHQIGAQKALKPHLSPTARAKLRT